jgi:hypothetical protein
MNYDLKIIGDNEMLRVEDGDDLKREWEQYKMSKRKDDDRIINLKNWTGSLSDIRSFRTAPASNSSNDSNYDEQYRKDMIKLNALSPEDKAKRMGFFRILYYGFTGMKSEEVMVGETPIENYAEKIQRKFFEENPKRVYCDPFLFKPIIKSKGCDEAVMRLVNNCIIKDKGTV